MIRRIASVLGCLLCIAVSSSATAYELATHARLTQAAISRSILSDTQFIKDLGIDPTAVSPFGDTYYDISGGTIQERRANPFEAGFMPVKAEETLTLPAWLLRGAIREDDYATASGVWVAPNPKQDQDPPQAFWRVMNHFFNPVNRQGLTLSPSAAEAFRIATGEADFRSAPNWALGTADAFTQPNTPDAARRNHFTVFDAREAMYRALTGKSNGNTDVATTKEARNKYWATTFRALGDIVHLVEDMAQPQHTRNDAHSGVPGYGHESVYEKYIDARATRARSFKIDGTSVVPDGLDYLGVSPNQPDGFPIPRFSRYSNYWSAVSGEGLADYSNRSFFSAGKNLGANEFLLPSNDAGSYAKESAAGLLPALPLHSVNFLRGGPDNIRMTTESVFDAFLLSGPPSYTLNRYNYDAMANLLIPRAAAYSAGLLDYFFRGRIEAQDAGFTDTGLVLRIKNAIDTQKQPAWMNENLANGATLRVTLQYDIPGSDPNSTVTTYLTSNAVTLTEDIKPGQASLKAYAFTLADPNLPDNATKVQYRLVYRGKLGNEDDAIAVGAFTPVSGFIVTPGSISANRQQVYNDHGTWRRGTPGLQAGNIDWKGWYVNGKPTKVLTWAGSLARYFPDYEQYSFKDQRRYSSSYFSSEIYQDGGLYAKAPGAVLGAAVTRDNQGDDWLIAVCMESVNGVIADVVYRRLYRQSDSPALYHAADNPGGWREIDRFPVQAGDGQGDFTQKSDVPWFFNGDGTEAQTLRRWWSAGINWPDGLLKRLKIKLAADLGSAGMQSLGNEPGFSDTYTCSDAKDTTTGAGNGIRTVTSSGSYIVAVDYDAAGEVLGRVKVGGQRVENWSYSNFGGAGTASLQGQYQDSLVINAGSGTTTIQLLSDSYPSGIARNWNGATYFSNIDRLIEHKEMSYILDLRYGLYSYYRAQRKASGSIYSTVNANGVPNGYHISETQDGDESDEIAANFLATPRQTFTRPIHGIREDALSSVAYYSACGQIWTPFGFFNDNTTYRRYGTSNMGWWMPYSGIVDSEGHYAISQQLFANSGYEMVGTANLLSNDGSLETLLPGANNYYPIMVVR